MIRNRRWTGTPMTSTFVPNQGADGVAAALGACCPRTEEDIKRGEKFRQDLKNISEAAGPKAAKQWGLRQVGLA